MKAREVKKIGVLGGGLMGGGIAYVTAALQGVPVRIKDKDDAGVGRALKQVQGILDERVKRRSLTWRERDAKLALVTARHRLQRLQERGPRHRGGVRGPEAQAPQCSRDVEARHAARTASSPPTPRQPAHHRARRGPQAPRDR